MIDGQPPYFNLPASEAMNCIRTLPPPTSKSPEKVRESYLYSNIGVLGDCG